MSNSTFLPFVTVIMPIRNEAAYIEQTVHTLLAQDYPAGRLEILLSDGMSTDGTRDILSSILNQKTPFAITLLDNPAQIVSAGLNLAIRQAKSDIIVRMDAHNEYETDYVRRVVLLLEGTGADNAGGVLIPVGSTYTQRAICNAFRSPISVGGSFQGHAVGSIGRGLQVERTGQSNIPVREVDTVHGGCWRRERLIEIGLFDEHMVRNQDDELSFRLRKAGGCIVQSEAIQIKYHVRAGFRKLFSQFAQYGYWKVPVIRRHTTQASIRHVVPSIFVTVLVVLAILSLFSAYAVWGLAILVVIYLSVLTFATLRTSGFENWRLWPGVVLAIIAMHFGFGFGFLVGIARQVLRFLPTDVFFARMTR